MKVLIHLTTILLAVMSVSADAYQSIYQPARVITLDFLNNRSARFFTGLRKPDDPLKVTSIHFSPAKGVAIKVPEKELQGLVFTDLSKTSIECLGEKTKWALIVPILSESGKETVRFHFEGSNYISRSFY